MAAEKKQDEKSNLVLSFVLYNEYKIKNPKNLLSKYNKICKPELKAEKISMKDNTISFEINGEYAFISFMPAPYPWTDLEGPCATSWLWPESAEQLKDHKKHIIITWMSKNEDRILISLVVTQITASVLEETDGLGVYWGNAALVNKKEVFCGMTDNIPETLPLFLWIDFRGQQHENGEIDIITYGLHCFDIMEIEIIKSKKSFRELIDFTYNIAGYLLEHGNAIKDGDTVGQDADQKILARHSDSVWDDERRGKVLRIEY